MKSTFESQSALSIRQLIPDDLQTYINFCKALPDPERYQHYWENDGQKLFNGDTPVAMFALWDKDKIVGQTAIAFDPDNPEGLAVFCESELAPSYRGQGLAKQLHHARINHLNEIGFQGNIETHIKPENTPSLSAAKRQGFIDTGEVHKGHCILKARLT